jgi:hypothetical protein
MEYPGLFLIRRLICLLAGGRVVALGCCLWKMVPSYLMWCLSREQNDRNFKNQERTLEKLKSFFSLFT